MSKVSNAPELDLTAKRQAAIIHPPGAMADHVRTFDWRATPLGGIESWSATLVSYVNLILASPLPATLLWGEEFTFLYNDAAIPTLGERHPEALGRNYREVFADAWPLVGPDIEDCVRRGKSSLRENVCIPLTRHGRVQNHLYTYYLVPIYEGSRIVGVYDPFLDVTQQRSDQFAREAAAETQRFLLALSDAQSSAVNGRQIMQISAELLARHLKVGRVGYSEATPDLESMVFETGWAQGELKTLSGSVPMDHWSERTSSDFSQGRTVVYPDVRREPTLVANVENYLAIGAVSVIAVPYLRRGVWRGSLYVNDARPRPWTSQEVTLVEEVAQRTAEAVERAQAEEELRALAGQLLEEREHMGLALLATRATAFSWDLEERNVRWTGRPFGRDPQELTRPENAFALIHPEDRDEVKRVVQTALRGQQSFQVEYRALWPDESVHWIRGSSIVLRDTEGKATRVLGIDIDISEQKHATEALLRTEKLAAVGRLASSIAHEINNPLESVTNLIYLVKSAAGVSAEMQQYMETADRELRRVSNIASQTLRFHKQATSAILCVGKKLFEDTLSIYQGRIVNAHIQVLERYRSEDSVECFEGEIRQVLSNLLANAIDAMPSGGRLLLRTRAATHPKSGRPGVTLTVADTGAGMPPGARQKVFEAFYSTKGFGGTGLGLWISKEIVDRHHGMLIFRSSQAPGKSGTVFQLFLPAEAARRS